MRSITFIAITAVVLLGLVNAHAQVGTPADEAAIRTILDARNAAYNRHDAKAMTSVYAADVDLFTGTGRYLRGRAELERYYAELFNGADKTAVVTISMVNLRFLTPDVALLDIDGTVTGRDDGTARNHATWTYAKRNGKWEVVAIRASRLQ